MTTKYKPKKLKTPEHVRDLLADRLARFTEAHEADAADPAIMQIVTQSSSVLGSLMRKTEAEKTINELLEYKRRLEAQQEEAQTSQSIDEFLRPKKPLPAGTEEPRATTHIQESAEKVSTGIEIPTERVSRQAKEPRATTGIEIQPASERNQ